MPGGQKGGAFPAQQFSLNGGDEDEDGDDTAVLERKIHGANMPPAALKVCMKELKRSAYAWTWARAWARPRTCFLASLTFSSAG